MRIEKVGGNRVGDAISSLRQLGLNEEKKMTFRGEEVVFFHRLKIKSKTTNVAEIDVEKVRGGIKTTGVAIKRVFCPGDIFGPLPR